MLEAFVSMYKNYFNFSGVTPRREFRLCFSMMLIISFIMKICGKFISPDIMLYVSIVYLVVSIIPWMSLMVRRLRDSGRHWAWILLYFTVIGGIVPVLMCGLCDTKHQYEGTESDSTES